MSGHRGTSAKAALATASVLVTLIVLVAGFEAVSRVRYRRWRASFDNEGWIGRLTVASANPMLLWEDRPYGDVQGVATNRWGFRDVDYPAAGKPPGVHRVAFIGNSVTLGMGVVPEETFVARVGAMARAAGLQVQTLNFGVDGYNALQVRELLTAKALAFEPDQVVYGIRAHDLLADFRRQPPPPQRYLLDLWHLSAAGHLVAAQALYPDRFPAR